MSERDELDDLAKALFEAARRDVPSDDVRARTLDASRRMEVARTGSSAALHARALSEAPRRARRPVIRQTAYAAIGIAAILTLAVLAFNRLRNDGDVSIGPESASARRWTPRASAPEPATAAPLPSGQSALEPAPARTSPRRALRSVTDARPVASVEPARPPASLSEEVAALDRARAALAAGDATSALRAIDEYEHVLRGTRLSEEATLLRIEALTRTGQAEAAAELARRFIEANPGSPLAERARAFARTNVSGVSKMDAGGTR